MLTNFGEAFAKNCLKKFYFNAIAPAISNTDYEGEVKALGDRVNILMFLDDVTLLPYVANTNMATQYPVDTESVLQIDRARYWNFNIDSVDKAFTYVDDEDSTLIANAGKVLEKAIDTDLLRNVEEVQAGHRVPNGPSSGGTWNYVVGATATWVVITTAGTWGVATLTNAIGENVDDEISYFPVDIVGRGFRICSTNFNSPWYRITARTSSTVLTFNNWDGSTETNPEDRARPTYTNSFIKGLWQLGVLAGGTGAGLGCQIEGMASTSVTATNVYQLVCELAVKLDEEGIPAEDRHLTIPAWFKGALVQAAQLQPDIAIYYTDTVINGKVGRVAGFDLHMTSDDRFSTAVSPIGSWVSSVIGTKILANHKSWITFAHKWAESRTVVAELQFANLYQGLNLWGFRVTPLRRSAGAYLYGNRA